MKKLVSESLNEWFVEDPEVDGDGRDEHEQEEEIEEEPEEEIEEETEEGSNKIGFSSNIEQDTIGNESFRKVLYTGENLQLVLMTLQPGEDIGEEVHENDQFFRFEEGSGIVVINENEYDVEDGSAIIVPAGSKHNIINTGEEDLKLYTLYSPPHHKDGIEYKTKEEAEESTENFDGKTTE